MKKVILMLVVFLTLKAISQPPPNGTYIINNNLDKFVGTWQWTSGTDTFRIVLQKQKVDMPQPHTFSEDLIVGWHRFVKNGVQKENSLQFYGCSYFSNHSTMTGSTLTPTKLFLRNFKEIGSKRRGDVVVRYISGSTPQLKWEMKYTGYGGNGNPSFYIPTNVILTKLNIPPPPPPTGPGD